MPTQRKTIHLQFEYIFETCKILISIEKNVIFCRVNADHTHFIKRNSCKNRNWRFTLRKHSENWEETWGCLNFHCGTTSAAQWEGKKKKNHLQQDGRREKDMLGLYAQRGEKLGRSLICEVRELTGQESIYHEEHQGSICSHLSHQRQTRGQYLWERLDQYTADTDELEVPFN